MGFMTVRDWRVPLQYVLLSSVIASVSGCTLCADGSDITKPDNVVDLVDPFPMKTCRDLSDAVAFLPDDACDGPRRLAAYCGCPVPEGACSICAVDEIIDRPVQPLDEILGTNTGMNCERFESVMNFVGQNSTECMGYPIDALKYFCGCTNSNQTAATDRGPGETCSFCSGGEIIPDDPVMDVRKIFFQDRENFDCLELKDLAKSVNMSDGGAMCTEIQRHSRSCGCPAPADSCDLCGQNAGELLGYTNMVTALDGKTMNCRTLAGLVTNLKYTDSQCLENQNRFAESCECGSLEDYQSTFVPCTMCALGESVPDPSKPIVGLDVDASSHFEQTCGAYEAAASYLNESSFLCRSTRHLGLMCGCRSPVGGEPCSYCKQGQEMKFPNKVLKTVIGLNLFADTDGAIGEVGDDQDYSCAIFQSTSGYYATYDEEECYYNRLIKGHSCGCPENEGMISLVWTQRASGFLSFLGSMYVIYVAVTAMRNEPGQPSTYHQIICGISVFDCASSIAYVFGTALTPTEYGLYGSIGNDATCYFQGFLFQLGLTSMYYNIFLSSYYILIVKYSWNERRFAKYRSSIHVIICFVGVSMAGIVTPFVLPDWRWCYLRTPPEAESWLQGILFYIAPVGLSIVIMTLNLVSMCWHVYQVDSKSSRRRLSNATRSVTSRTFWQSFWFLSAFYAVWPVQFASFVVPVVPKNYWIFWTASLLGPLQGLFNAMIVYKRRNPGGLSLSSTSQSWFSSSNLRSTRILKRRLAPQKNNMSEEIVFSAENPPKAPHDAETASGPPSSDAHLVDTIPEIDPTPATTILETGGKESPRDQEELG